jgi:hypothetical protein
MADITELQKQLAEFNRHIIESRARIARQRELICQLSADDHNVAEAKDLLWTLVGGLEAMQRHREHIGREWSRAE